MPEQDIIKESVCYMCHESHPIKVHVRNGQAVSVEMLNPQVRNTCPRWKAQLDYIYHPDRLLYPLKRAGERGKGTFSRISWDEALDTTASKLQEIKDQYGAEAVVFWICYAKEPRPYYHRLVHAFGSPNFCLESNCMTASQTASAVTYGNDYISFTGQSMKSDPASKCKMVWSSSIRNSFPENWQDHMEARRNGLKLIVVDPRRTGLASLADIHLQLRPGTDGALALGMMNIIISEGLQDAEFVERWTVGFNELRELVQKYPPERVEQITRVPAEKIRRAAIMYATEKPAKIGLSPSATTHTTNGVQNQRAIILLPALTGNLAIPGGNRCFPPPLPVADISLHDRLAGMPAGLGADRFPIWVQTARQMQANLISERIESGVPYPIKALYSAGMNLACFPNTNRFVENIRKLDFIVVTEFFRTPGTEYADIILPVASWLERNMLILPPYSPGIAKITEPVIEPQGETWPEWKIIFELAKRLGLGSDFWDGSFQECLKEIFRPSGRTPDEIIKHPEGVPFCAPPGPAKNYAAQGFKTPSGKVEIASSILAKHGYDALPVYREPEESPISRPDLAKDYPLVLTTGVRQVSYTGTRYRNIPQLNKMIPEPLAEINPADAVPRSVQSGDMITVSSPRGSIKLKAQVTDSILPGVVMVPYEWSGEANVNILIDDQKLDPISGYAPMKSQLCQVAKI
jgi:anaerobic selenocysteine-containing dehydrogenase